MPKTKGHLHHYVQSPRFAEGACCGVCGFYVPKVLLAKLSILPPYQFSKELLEELKAIFSPQLPQENTGRGTPTRTLSSSDPATQEATQDRA